MINISINVSIATLFFKQFIVLFCQQVPLLQRLAGVEFGLEVVVVHLQVRNLNLQLNAACGKAVGAGEERFVFVIGDDVAVAGKQERRGSGHKEKQESPAGTGIARVRQGPEGSAKNVVTYSNTMP